MSVSFDLVIRHAEIATATDRYVADIGIVNGKIQAIESRYYPRFMQFNLYKYQFSIL